MVPEFTPVARPDAFTVAVAGTLLVQVKVTPETSLLDASFAFAVNCCVPPSRMVALTGVISTLATTAGGTSTSLHALKVLAIGPLFEDGHLEQLVTLLEDAGLVYFEEFFELSGNWPEWLTVHVLGA